MKCPKCDDRVEEGYGLAHGGGIGVYRDCLSPTCHWYEKDIEPNTEHLECDGVRVKGITRQDEIKFHEALKKERNKMPEEIEETLKQRGKRYGEFKDHAALSQELKDVLRKHAGPKWDLMTPDMREALEMFCHKIARIINGDPFYEDSWHDIAGYAKLVRDRLLKIIKGEK